MAISKFIPVNHDEYDEYAVVIEKYTTIHKVNKNSNAEIIIRHAIAAAIISIKIPIIITKVSHN